MREQGLGLLDEPLRIEAFLRDLAVDDQRGVYLLVQALRQGVVRSIADAARTGGIGYLLFLDQAVLTLEGYGLSSEAARFAVEAWSSALGFPVDVETGPGAVLVGRFEALDRDRQVVGDLVEAAAELHMAGSMVGAWSDVVQLCAAAERSHRAAERGTARAAQADPDDRVNARVAEAIERASAAVAEFRVAHAAVLDRAAAAQTSLPVLVREARTCMQEARAAVDRSRRTGAMPSRALELIGEAQVITVDLESHAGFGARYRAAQRIVDLAQEAALLAENTSRTAEQVRTALSSLPIRRGAATERIHRMAGMLAELRVKFDDSDWIDLDSAADRASEAIVEAGDAIGSARQLSAAEAWEAAADQITAAVAALGRAENMARAVADRLAVVQSVRADPDVHAAAAGFAIRDAQVLLRGATAHDHHAFLEEADTELADLSAAVRESRLGYLAYLDCVEHVRLRVLAMTDEVRAARRSP